jgi:hypothetical protein
MTAWGFPPAKTQTATAAAAPANGSVKAESWSSSQEGCRLRPNQRPPALKSDSLERFGGPGAESSGGLIRFHGQKNGPSVDVGLWALVAAYSFALSPIKRPVSRLIKWIRVQAKHRTPS